MFAMAQYSVRVIDYGELTCDTFPATFMSRDVNWE